MRGSGFTVANNPQVAMQRMAMQYQMMQRQMLAMQRELVRLQSQNQQLLAQLNKSGGDGSQALAERTAGIETGNPATGNLATGQLARSPRFVSRKPQ